jgi:hypothetical protein
MIPVGRRKFTFNVKCFHYQQLSYNYYYHHHCHKHYISIASTWLEVVKM